MMPSHRYASSACRGHPQAISGTFPHHKDPAREFWTMAGFERRPVTRRLQAATLYRLIARSKLHRAEEDDRRLRPHRGMGGTTHR